jgi:hypothetical protein
MKPRASLVWVIKAAASVLALKFTEKFVEDRNNTTSICQRTLETHTSEFVNARRSLVTEHWPISWLNQRDGSLKNLVPRGSFSQNRQTECVLILEVKKERKK